ncbi:SusC/RagA family TonB-linked outer membrane protein [Maribellus comscasis]|nr:SusC/RagA family TonB-linked outer membrane protein [Maribellus comscasis]
MKKKYIILFLLGWFICRVLYAGELTPFRNQQEEQVSEKTATLQLQNLTYSQALKKIAETFEVGLAVNSDLIPQGKVNLQLKGVTLRKALDLLLEETETNAFVSPQGNIILRKDSSPQIPKKQNIRGRVSSTKGESLPGVSIIIKGTSQGVVTNAEGKYFLTNIAEDATLVFSFVGMKPQEVPVSGRTVIDIVLEENTIGIEEVVAIGYGSAKRKDLTSSISTLSSDELNKGAYVNPILALQGKVPGLNITKDGNPNGGTAITLRGPSTLRTGSAQSPLYVIDGVVDGLMPADDDIVSIDILRDASATAIYGSRAANGVIIITTKKGQPGYSMINYSAYLAVESVSNKIDMLSASEYRSYLSTNGLSLDPADDDGSSTNWFDEVSRLGISHNNNVALGGGNNSTTYIANIDYKENEGIINGTSRTALKMRANLEQKALQDKLKLGCTISAQITDAKTVTDELYLAMWNYLPTVGVFDEGGSYHENLDRGSSNPVALIEQNDYDYKYKNYLGTVRAQLNIIKGLDWEMNTSYKNNQTNYAYYLSKDSRLAEGYNGYAYRSSYESEIKSMETFGTYQQKIKEHDLKLLLGYSWYESKSGNGFGVNSTNFVSDETSYYNLALGSNYDGFSPDYDDTSMGTLRMISFYSRLNYAFKDKYLLQATIRRDGSSAFGENNRWGYFPAFSLGWRILEESFMQNQNIFDNLKLRAGYGISGNSLGFNPLISKLRYGTTGKFYYDGEYINGIGPTQNPNPDLKWEQTGMLNLGLDFSILNGRLSGTIEYYDKVTKDLIWNYTVSTTEYYVSSLTANVGEMENKGFEISLNATPVKSSEFSWNTSLNLSFNKNNINSLSNDEFELDYVHTASIGDHGQSGNYAQIIEEGKPLGQFYIWKYAGKDEDGISQFYNADRELTSSPSSDDHFYAGNAQPKATGGWYNTLTWKNFSLDLLLRGVTGNKILNATMANLNYPAEATHYNLPRMTLKESVDDTGAHYTSDRYLEKGDYIRLDNITLSYNFKLNDFILKKLKIYTTVNNAFVITSYTGTDPEVHMGGQTPGIDNDDYYPKTRSVIFGVNVEF